MKLIVWFGNRYGQDDVSAHAAQVSFFIMISLFPFVLFLLTLLQFTPISQTMLLSMLDQLIPDILSSTMNSWVHEIYNKSNGAVISFAAVAALWAGSKGFLGIENALQKIYKSENRRNFIIARLLSIAYTILFSLMILLTLTGIVYGNRILQFLHQQLPALNHVFLFLFSLRMLLGIGIFTYFFALVYTFIPNRKLKLHQQLPGAVFASCLWLLFSYFYSLYIDYLTNFSSLYGSLSYIVLFLLWLYFCMNILFIGAELNMYLEERHLGKKR